MLWTTRGPLELRSQAEHPLWSLCGDRGLIEDALTGRASLVSTSPETSHSSGGWEVCPQHPSKQLLCASPVCQRPLKDVAGHSEHLALWLLSPAATKSEVNKEFQPCFCIGTKHVALFSTTALHAVHPPAWSFFPFFFGFGTVRAAFANQPYNPQGE